MLQRLRPHPDDICNAISAIDVEVERRENLLDLRYKLIGDIDQVRLPAFAEPRRADELWHHSCFETFIREPGAESYLELNFAPSGEWAAYRFARYRSGRSDAELSPLALEASPGSGDYELRVSCPIDLPAQAPWEINLTTIVEETSGRKSYWALAHPPGKADFHHDAGFVLHLAAVA